MSTRLELRTSVRLRLEDSSGTPLYPDATLNDYLAQGLREYGTWAPLLATTAIAAVAVNSTTIALPANVPQHTITAVRDGAGADVRVMSGRTAYGPDRMVYHEQAWRIQAGSLRLQRAVGSAEAGTWNVDHLVGRVLVADDVTAQPIEAGDEPVVIQLAIAQAYEQRAFEDYKRGVKSGNRESAADVRYVALTMFRLGRRLGQTTWMDVA